VDQFPRVMEGGVQSVVVVTRTLPPTNPPAQLRPPPLPAGAGGNLAKPKATPRPINHSVNKSNHVAREPRKQWRPDKWKLTTCVALLVAVVSLAVTLYLLTKGTSSRFNFLLNY